MRHQSFPNYCQTFIQTCSFSKELSQPSDTRSLWAPDGLLYEIVAVMFRDKHLFPAVQFDTLSQQIIFICFPE